MMRRIALILIASVATLVSGCGGGGPPFGVETTIVSDLTTNDIRVYAPDGDGPWPVVYALPGTSGSAERDLDVLATELARQGVVVFASDFKGTALWTIENDAECGYRFSRSLAAEYGGDLTAPVTMVGYSQGAALVLRHGLNQKNFGLGSDYISCFEGSPRPEVIVAINGCYLTTPDLDIESNARYWDNKGVDLLIVSGDNDEVCGLHQAEEAAVTLTDAGYGVTLMEIPDANHWEVVFHNMAYGVYDTLPSDHPAGQATTQAILDVITGAQL